MVAPPAEIEGKTVFETIKKRPLDNRKRNKNDDPGDINGFLGPWGGFVGEQRYIQFVIIFIVRIDTNSIELYSNPNYNTVLL